MKRSTKQKLFVLCGCKRTTSERVSWMQCDKLGCYSCKYSSRAGYGIFPEKNPAIEMVKMVGGRLPKGYLFKRMQSIHKYYAVV